MAKRWLMTRKRIQTARFKTMRSHIASKRSFEHLRDSKTSEQFEKLKDIEGKESLEFSGRSN